MTQTPSQGITRSTTRPAASQKGPDVQATVGKAENVAALPWLVAVVERQDPGCTRPCS
jgi:hypothetical protein